MSRIRGKDTSIEKTVRSYLFARGFRFRKNDKRYPGHPDIVLPKYLTIVFVNGCFWHMHEGCESFCFASMSFQQAHQYFSAVWADGFPRSRHHAVSDVR